MPLFSPRRIVLSLALGALGVTEAFPADMLEPPIPPAARYVEEKQVPMPASGFYFGGRQMFGISDDTSFDTGGGATSIETKYEFSRFTGAILGYSFGPMFGFISPRVELEGNFGTLSVDEHTVTTLGVQQPISGTDSFGELRATTGLVNAYFDANLGHIAGALPDSHLWSITPFIGAGIGASHVTLRRQGTSNTGVAIDSSDTQMTWQVSAGVGYRIFDNMTMEVSFRHQRTDGLNFTARDGTTSSTDLVNNMIMIGMRRQF